MIRHLWRRRHLARRLDRLGADLRLGQLHSDGLTTVDEIVAFARQSGQSMLPIALSVQSSYRWQVEDAEGAAESAGEAIPLLEPLAADAPSRYGPDLLRTRRVLALAYVDLDRLTQAVPALQRYVRMLRLAPVEQEPSLSKALRLLVDAYRRLDRPADAVPHAEELVRIARHAADDDNRRFNAAMALCTESTCRKLAGLPAEPTAIDAVAEVCRRVTGLATNGGTRALAQALEVLSAAHGEEPDAELTEIGRWRASDRSLTDIHAWLEDAKQDHEKLARLLERATHALVAYGRFTEANRAACEALTVYQLAPRRPRSEAGTTRIIGLLRRLEQLT